MKFLLYFQDNNTPLEVVVREGRSGVVQYLVEEYHVDTSQFNEVCTDIVLKAALLTDEFSIHYCDISIIKYCSTY